MFRSHGVKHVLMLHITGLHRAVDGGSVDDRFLLPKRRGQLCGCLIGRSASPGHAPLARRASRSCLLHPCRSDTVPTMNALVRFGCDGVFL
jgi:hypothetical protein